MVIRPVVPLVVDDVMMFFSPVPVVAGIGSNKNPVPSVNSRK